MFRLREIITILAAGMLTFSHGALAKRDSRKARSAKTANKSVKKPAAKQAVEKPVVAKQPVKQVKEDPVEAWITLKAKFAQRQLTDAQVWVAIDQFEKKKHLLPEERRHELAQLRSDLLLKSGYPIMAALFAGESLQSTKDLMDSTSVRSWEILAKISKSRPIQEMIENLAADPRLKNEVPKVFGNDWHYYVANALVSEGKLKEAVESYDKIRISDRFFLPSKFQKGSILALQGDLEKAEVEFKSILRTEVVSLSPLKSDLRNQIQDLARLALGRMYYQDKNFGKAIAAFRSVNREGAQFYDALSNQAWALFMAGYPNHALGALYGAESPFFKDVYNPELPMLRAVIFYWMCRYEDSRSSLADFNEKHLRAVDNLSSILNQRAMSEERAYDLFENLVTGVSSESLGIPREVLNTAAQEEGMLLLRDQYAAWLVETQKLEKKGMFGTTEIPEIVQQVVGKMSAQLRKKIGRQFLSELKAMQQQYIQLNEQGQFLYVELLMSKKEQLLGRELHASSKLTEVPQAKNVKGWSGQSMAWSADGREEFWWDEVGFHIYEAQPECAVNQ
jgi:tetratricopeptide (TPR) repeat protein